MYSNDKNSTFLVSYFQQLINQPVQQESQFMNGQVNRQDSFGYNNMHEINSFGNNNKRLIKKSFNRSSDMPIQNGIQKSFNNTTTIGQYSLWNNCFDISTVSQDSLDSDSSSPLSPCSSLESNSSLTANFSSNGPRQKELKLPSVKAQIDISKCLERNKRQDPNKLLICSFCKNNGEPEHIYKSHLLKDSFGKITCPLLKIYKCPICGESGKNAHTITYCKKYKASKRMDIINKLN